MRLIPSMDLLGGQVVRLLKGERRSAFVYPTSPEAWIGRLVAAGARRIHLVDLDAAFGEAPQQALRGFARAWPGVRFQLGGGLRSREAVERVQDDGFDAVVGTLALETPEALEGLDPARIIAALDVRFGAPVVRGWTAASAKSMEAAAAPLRALGASMARVPSTASNPSSWTRSTASRERRPPPSWKLPPGQAFAKPRRARWGASPKAASRSTRWMRRAPASTRRLIQASGEVG